MEHINDVFFVTGGRRCLHDGCDTSAAGGGTQHCIHHGGGLPCIEGGCGKLAVSNGTQHCSCHGGGKASMQGLFSLRSTIEIDASTAVSY